jgi:BirA family biotin operon repressor/biotin-[acetyl-CoA-carboxylase] ligase
VPSTNKLAQQLLQTKELPEGSVVLANDQFAGRGRHNKKWQSAPGQNITLSVIFYPKFLKATHQFFLTQAVSLAVWELVDELLPVTPAIKWPNDIVCRGKKLAGILTETQVSGSILANAVVGIGLNVNQTQFPDLLQATSLKLLGNQSFDRSSCIEQLFSHLERYYLKLKKQEKSGIRRQYTQNMWGYQEERKFFIDGASSEKEVTGRVLGVTEAGKLSVELGGKVQHFLPGEITFKIGKED